jgi:pimeloyl-ACP methyl ester carboxylesterase
MPSQAKQQTAVQPAPVRAPVRSRRHPIRGLARGLIRLGFLAAGGWIGYSHLLADHQLPLPKAIPAEQELFAFRPTGSLNVYIDRQSNGRPLLLLHSINAAASAYEMRPLFQHYRGQRPVAALDMPGFGFSIRANVAYTPPLFVKAVLAALAHLDAGPVDVIALSLSCEFAAEAARQQPDLVRSLTLISPTGLNRRAEGGSQTAEQRGYAGFAHELLSVPLWARPLFDLLTTRRSIEYFLQKSFVGSVPSELVEYDYATAHQPGAEHAPLTFVSGKLFTTDALDAIYSQVQTPSLVLYDRDNYTSHEQLPLLLSRNPAFRAERVAPTLGMPHFERLQATTQAIDRFWASLG